MKINTRITASSSFSLQFLNDLFTYRQVAMMVAGKVLRTKYRETYLGPFWAILQPLVHMLVLNLFFGLVVKFSSGNVPYSLHLLTGLVAFQFFTRSVNEGAGSITRNGGILTKIFLPRIIFPASSLIVVVVDTTFPLALLGAFLFYYDIAPTLRWLVLIPLGIWLVLLGVAGLLFFSAACVRFNDFRMAVPIFTQLLFFGTPIFYPLQIVPNEFLWFYNLNPCVSIVEIFRWIILGYPSFPDQMMVQTGLISTMFCLVLGVVTFGLVDREFYKYV
tara:strand:+ start:2382 stop:3206 length:825 start_codon:yes stop_codon:yes gene_type:complete